MNFNKNEEELVLILKSLNTNNINLKLHIEKELEKYEPLLIENNNRFVILPINYHDIWKMYKKHQSTYWVAEEIDLLKDIDHWNKELSPNDRHFITYVLAFFASFDGIVNENLTERFMSEVQIPEARSFYGFQIMIENVHSEVYSLLIDTFISDPLEKDKIFKAIENFPSIKKMAQWAIKWTKSDLPFNRRILAYTCIEGIMFSGPFSSIYWIKKRGIMPGLTFSNELISKDEGLHMEFGILMHNSLKYPANTNIIHEIVTECVDLCREFINESLPCKLIGMNSNDMTQYIEYVADRLLIKLGAPKIWNSTNPFVGWMEMISLETKTNFFERKVAEYSKSKSNMDIITGTTNNTNTILEDF